MASYAVSLGILVCLEGPENSAAWSISPLWELIQTWHKIAFAWCGLGVTADAKSLPVRRSSVIYASVEVAFSHKGCTHSYHTKCPG